MVGFNCQNKDVFQEYLCCICSLLYREPVQLGCGHRFCKSCAGNPSRETIRCMQCHEETMGNQMFSDRGVERDMKMLVISCFHCQWNGSFQNYRGHLTMNHLNISTYLHDENRAVFEVQQLHETFIRFIEHVRIVQAAIEQISFSMSSYKTSVEKQNHDLFIPCDGTLLMTIVNVQSRLNDNHCVITSPPFYTSRDGYKMCVRVYLNGDGSGQSTHVSIYLILMRGDYDTILKWPFDHQIIFCLYDLTDEKNHIIESLQPDEGSVCFERPQDEMNTAAGFAQFLPRSKIQQDHSLYLSEGSIRIKVMVRKNPIPTSLLNKILNINLALPVHAQEEIIEREIQNIKPSSKLNLVMKPQQPL